MTWQHYQQLKSAAQARISQRLAELQPRGGHGCTVLGNSIALEPLPGPPPEPDPETWRLSIFITVDITHEGAGSDGAHYHDEHHWGPVIAATVLRDPIAGRDLDVEVYTLENTMFGYLPPDEESPGFYHSKLRLRVEAVAYEWPKNRSWLSVTDQELYDKGWFPFPVEVTFDHILLPGWPEVMKQDRVRVYRGGVTYEPSPLQPDALYKLGISKIQRI